MVRFTAEIDSPPLKPPLAKIKKEPQDISNVQDTPISASPRKRGRFFRRRKLNERFRELKDTNDSPARANLLKRPRCSIEFVLLLCIVVCLGYYGLKDMEFTSPCEKHLSKEFTLGVHWTLTQEVFRQESAIQNISSLLESHRGLTMMSFIGGTGTGKTMIAKLISTHYGNANTRNYNWESPEGKTQVDHVNDAKKMILDIPSCELHLLIVDNLSWDQKPYVEDLGRWLQTSSRVGNMNLVVIFVFNFNSYKENFMEHVQEDVVMRGLEMTNVVFFKPFRESDAMDYLVQLREKSQEEVEFDLNDLELIVSNANVRQHGLKRLANKFHIYN